MGDSNINNSTTHSAISNDSIINDSIVDNNLFSNLIDDIDGNDIIDNIEYGDMKKDIFSNTNLPITWYSNTTFMGSNPDLIHPRVIAELERELDVPTIDNRSSVGNTLYWFYDDIILPNMFPIIVILALIIYLVIRYIIKQDKDEKLLLEIKEKERREMEEFYGDDFDKVKSQRKHRKIKRISDRDKVAKTKTITKRNKKKIKDEEFDKVLKDIDEMFNNNINNNIDNDNNINNIDNIDNDIFSDDMMEGDMYGSPILGN